MPNPLYTLVYHDRRFNENLYYTGTVKDLLETVNGFSNNPVTMPLASYVDVTFPPGTIMGNPENWFIDFGCQPGPGVEETAYEFTNVLCEETDDGEHPFSDDGPLCDCHVQSTAVRYNTDMLAELHHQLTAHSETYGDTYQVYRLDDSCAV